jgi:hypothetical protein
VVVRHGPHLRGGHVGGNSVAGDGLPLRPLDSPSSANQRVTGGRLRYIVRPFYFHIIPMNLFDTF